MSQAGIINVIENNPTIPIYFDAETGFAVALFNVIKIVGDGANITTTATGNTITIHFTGSSGVEQFTVDAFTAPGTNPVAPNGSGIVTVTGNQVAAGVVGAKVIRTNSLAANTYAIEIQRSQAVAASTVADNGVSHFNSAGFTVDANGFVSLLSTGLGVLTVSGTANRITSTGGQNPVIDISAAYVGQASITTLGTITTGVWNGTAIGPTFGGTGLTTYTTGDTLYASASNVLSKLPIGTTNQVLTVIAGIPSWQTPTTGTVTSVSGTLNRITSTGGTTPVIDIAATYVGQTSLTTLGTITTGVWNGTAIGPTFGGTGIATYTTGDTLYASASNVLSKLPIGTTNQVLTVIAGIPSWQTPTTGTVTSVSGTLNRITSTGGATPVIDIAATYVGQTSITTLGTIATGVWNGTAVGATFGGTSQTTYATGDMLYASAANTLSKLTIGSSNQVLVVTGGIPVWTTLAPGGVTSVSGTTNRITSTGGATPVIDISAAYVGQTSITTLGTIATGVWNGTAVGPTFGGTGLTTYTTGDILYASASNVLSKLAAGTNTFVLTMAAGIPSWAAPAAGGVSSVTGTTNRITVSPTTGATVVDIAATYVGQTSITTLGTIATGTWQGTAVDATHGGTAQTTWTTGDLLYASASNTLSKLPIGSSTQVLTVSGGIPAWAAASGGTLPWTNVTGTTQAMSPDNGYMANNAGLVTLTLPTTAAQFTMILISGFGAGGWKIAQNASQSIRLGDQTTTVGTGGSVSSNNLNDQVSLMCVVANTTWIARAGWGNLVIV